MLIVEFIAYPLLWWFVVYLFLALGQPPHHKIHKMLLLASCANVAFILIYYGIYSYNDFDELKANFPFFYFFTY